jgi:hypothetical protein
MVPGPGIAQNGTKFSGAVEATCRQYQCRLKRPGEFWNRTGDEALLAL